MASGEHPDKRAVGLEGSLMLCTNCSEPVKPIAAIDIDGVLGNYHEQFTEFAELYTARSMPRGYTGNNEFSDYLGLDKTLYRQIKLAYRQGGTKRWMPMYAGADRFMQHLRNLDVEIWIASTRPWDRLDNIDPDTRFWLTTLEMPFDFMVYGDDKYDQLAEQINPDRVVAVVEDIERYCYKAQSLFGDVVWQPVRERTEGQPYQRTFVGWDDVLVDVEMKVKAWPSS